MVDEHRPARARWAFVGDPITELQATAFQHGRRLALLIEVMAHVGQQLDDLSGQLTEVLLAIPVLGDRARSVEVRLTSVESGVSAVEIVMAAVHSQMESVS